MRALALPLRRPVGTAAVAAAIVLLALHAMHDLPLGLAPDTTEPQLVVRIGWPNAAPEAMEALVTSRIEAEAARLRGAREVASTSGVGWGEVVIEFDRGTRMDRAEVFLRERLASMRDILPAQVSPPEIAARGQDDVERFLVLRAGGPRTAEALREVMRDILVPRLAAVPGVASVQVYGGSEREIHVDLDAGAVGRGLVDAPRVSAVLDEIQDGGGAGTVARGGTRIAVVQDRRTPHAERLRDSAVGGAGGRPLRVGDVAQVRDAWDEPRRLARIDGVPAVQVVLEREPGSNVLRLSRRVRAALAALESALPPDIAVEPVYDQSKRIADELSALARRSGLCVLAAGIALWLSLRRTRAPFAVLISVAGSALLTLLAFRVFGLGIDLVTLSGLALAFGMSVDSSIVLLTSIAQHAGAKARVPRIVAAVRQVLLPLLAGTLTTAVVMVPFLYVTGDLRTYYLPFVLAVGMSLAASFAVGLALTPLLSRFALTGSVFEFRRLRLPSVERVYAPFLSWTLRRPAIPIVVAALVLAASLWVFHAKVGRGSLFGGDPDTGLRVRIALPRGAEIERVDALLARFEHTVLEHPFRSRGYIEQVQAFVVDERAFLDVRLAAGVAFSSVPQTLQQELVAIAAGISGAEVSVTGHGPGFSSTRAQTTPSYQFTLRGADYIRLGALAEDLGQRLGREPRVRDIDVNASDWTVDGATELFLVPERARLARLGIPMRDLVATLQPAIAGQFADRRLPGKNGDIEARVRYDDGQARSREQLLAMTQATPAAAVAPLVDLAHIEERPVVPEIRRRRQQYERVVTFDFRGPRPVGNDFVRAFLRGTTLPPGYSIEEGLGLFLARREERELALALVLASVLVYMVGAALFESWVLPFVAILGVPLGFAGVATSFWIAGQPFDRAAYVGLILLTGIAINSALLLVHRAGSLLRRGLERRTAMRRAALERCRPIVLTTVVHVAGLAPLAVAANEGSADTWRGLALAACSGLGVAAIATLAVVPALFVVLAPRHTRRTADRATRVLEPKGSRTMRRSPAFVLTAAVTLALAAPVARAGDDGKRIEAKSPSAKGGYRVASEVAIGGPTAAAEAQFYEKNGTVEVGADARGNIYVLDNGGPRVQIFDAAGRFVRGFGKAGEGPGEMKMPARMAVGADGQVAVFDIALNRISVYDARGKLLRDQVPPQPVRDLAFTANGTLVCSFHGAGGDVVEAFDAAGKSLWAHRPPEAAPAGGRVMMFEIGNETVGSRLEPAANGDVFLGGRDVYAVRRLHAGAVTQTWSRPYERQARPPLPRPADDGDGPTATIVVRREGGGGAQTSVSGPGSSGSSGAETHTFTGADLERMMPKHSPDIRGLLAWPDGRLWVITSTNDGDTMLVDEWMDGEYRVRFGIPATWDRLRVGADGKLYGVTHDADEYPIVHRVGVAPAS